MVKVKICGITNLEDALMAIQAGADMIGFVFVPGPRHITPEQAVRITTKVPPETIKIGVFMNSELDLVKKIKEECNLNGLQLHGSESPEYCRVFPSGIIKSFRIKDASVLGRLPLYQVEAYLLDTYDAARAGGTGKTFDWNIAKEAKKYGRIILAGGLTPENVAQAIAQAEPYGVDVSSGVELRPGKKDPEKVKAFIKAAKRLV